jgi:hypothetical protein
VGEAADLAPDHIAAFNEAVARGDFAAFLARFADDAVMRFDNVPGVGVMEFAGRAAFTSAYERNPPDDQMDVDGPVREEGGDVVIPFAWRRDGATGVLRLTASGGLIARMVVSFD